MAHNPYHETYIPGTHRGSTANPLFQGPLISREKRDQFKTGFNNLFGGNKNPYESTNTPALDMEQNGNIFQPNKEFLQSDAKTGRIFGGTRAERVEARKLREPGSGPGIGAGAIAGMAGQVFGMFDKDKNKYGNADILGDVAGGVAQGAAFGPAGMLFMGGKALIEGLGKKKRQIEHDKKMDHNAKRDANASLEKHLAHKDAETFFGKQKAATAGAYGIQDINMFINKYA